MTPKPITPPMHHLRAMNTVRVIADWRARTAALGGREEIVGLYDAWLNKWAPHDA